MNRLAAWPVWTACTVIAGKSTCNNTCNNMRSNEAGGARVWCSRKVAELREWIDE